MLPLQARVDLGVMAMKGYPAFPKAPALLEPTIRLFSLISRTLVGRDLSPLHKSSWYILQLQPIGQYTELNVKTVLFQTIHFSISIQFKYQNNSISSNSF